MIKKLKFILSLPYSDDSSSNSSSNSSNNSTGFPPHLRGLKKCTYKAKKLPLPNRK